MDNKDLIKEAECLGLSVDEARKLTPLKLKQYIRDNSESKININLEQGNNRYDKESGKESSDNPYHKRSDYIRSRDSRITQHHRNKKYYKNNRNPQQQQQQFQFASNNNNNNNNNNDDNETVVDFSFTDPSNILNEKSKRFDQLSYIVKEIEDAIKTNSSLLQKLYSDLEDDEKETLTQDMNDRKKQLQIAKSEILSIKQFFEDYKLHKQQLYKQVSEEWVDIDGNVKSKLKQKMDKISNWIEDQKRKLQ